jgi:PAS domain S-box-containing protein
MAEITSHLTSLFTYATEGIILTDHKGCIMLMNPAAEKMFGYKSNELAGLPIEKLIPDRFKTKHVTQRTAFCEKPSNRAMGQGRELYGKRKDGTELPVEVSLSHYYNDGELFVIAFLVDITHRKEIEKNLLNKQRELEKVTNDIRKLNTELELRVDERTHILKEALQKLEQSQHELNEALDKERQLNEIKSRFVSMASHEFRTPLSAVLSSASLLSKYTKTEEQDKRDRHITRIKESVKHLNDILEDFLSLGRLDEGRVAADPSEFNMREMIDETLADLKLLLKPGQTFKTIFTANEILCADKKLLKNILINLLSNAIKFSGENSPIELEASMQNGQAVITITDHGIGISPEDQQHLFSSFFRGTNATNIQGTGLGLHIVKRYIDLMNGTVHLQSEPGKGTSVTITFPCSQTNHI